MSRAPRRARPVVAGAVLAAVAFAACGGDNTSVAPPISAEAPTTTVAASTTSVGQATTSTTDARPD